MARLARIRRTPERDRPGAERGILMPAFPVPAWVLANLGLVCLLLLFLDLTGLRYGYFWLEKSFGGFGIVGLMLAVAVLLVALALRPLLVRRADLYGPYEGSSGESVEQTRRDTA